MSTPSGGQEEGVSPFRVIIQIGLLVLTFCLWTSPIVQPVKIMVVLLHEVSHGLMALASGGTVHKILITPDQGGSCQSAGGNTVLISAAGYLGSMFFGGLFLRAARGGASVTFTYFLMSFLMLGAAVTVLQDHYSRVFAFSVSGSFIFLGLFSPTFIGAIFLRAIGTVSCLYAIFDIYDDILAGGPGRGMVPNDAVTFAAHTGVPVYLVGLTWLGISVLFFLIVLKGSLKSVAAKPA